MGKDKNGTQELNYATAKEKYVAFFSVTGNVFKFLNKRFLQECNKSIFVYPLFL